MGLEIGSKTFNIGIEGEKIEFISKWLGSASMVWHHFIRDHQQKGDISIESIGTEDQLANIFTKPLDEKRFCKLRNELNILDSPTFTCDMPLLQQSKVKLVDIAFILC